MAKPSRSKKPKQPEAPADTLPGADLTPASEGLTPDDFSHATPQVTLVNETNPIAWPPVPPPPALKVTVVAPLPKPVAPAPAAAAPTPSDPIEPASIQTAAINAHHRINLAQVILYRLDKADVVVMIGADGAQYIARGEYAAAIHNAIGA